MPSYLCEACRREVTAEKQLVEYQPISTTMPLFSIIIGVYNDWIALDPCLRSLAQQTHGPTFEVIVVDDGSSEAAPEVIRQWVRCLHLTIVRQSHAGISAARNHGIQISRGSVLLFVDADCRLQTNCLAVLGSTITDSPQHNCFQLHLVGDCRGPVGRAEELRLRSFQEHMLQPDGRIRYLNTAGFAIRRMRVILRGFFLIPSCCGPKTRCCWPILCKAASFRCLLRMRPFNTPFRYL